MERHTLSQRLKFIREDLNIPENRAARKANMSIGRLRKIEKNAKDYPLNDFLKLSKVYNIPVTKIFYNIID